MIQITQLRHKCIGCNACVEAAPDRWIMSKTDGKSYLRKAIQKGKYYIINVDDEEEEDNRIAAQNCPVNIIWVKELW